MIGELLKLQSWSVSGKQYQTDNGLLCNCTLPFGGVNVCFYVSDASISTEDEVRVLIFRGSIKPCIARYKTVAIIFIRIAYYLRKR